MQSTVMKSRIVRMGLFFEPFFVEYPRLCDLC